MEMANRVIVFYFPHRCSDCETDNKSGGGRQRKNITLSLARIHYCVVLSQNKNRNDIATTRHGKISRRGNSCAVMAVWPEIA